MKSKIVVIIGQTASGKSDLAISIARKYNSEIISADSRQVYRGMDIGTGKVSKREQRLVPHHLIDVADPKRQFSVADFKSRAQRAIKDIAKRGKLAIVVGGTGFYVDALVYDLDLPEVKPDRVLRMRFDKLTAEQLFKLLRKKDPARAKTIDRYNKVRLIRALEIIDALGKVPKIKKKSPYDVLWIGLNPSDLNKRIEARLNKRFHQGMLVEVKKLSKKVSKKRLYDFGLEYRWISEYLQNKISKQEMADGLSIAINQYAKRQMTWFKRNPDIHWTTPAQASKLVDKFLTR